MTGGAVTVAPRLAAPRPLITSAAAGGASALLALAAHSVLDTSGYSWLLTVLLAAAAAVPVAIDIRTRKLPNQWVAPIAVAGAVQAIAVAYASADVWRVLWPLIAAAIVFAFYVALGLAGMFGLGDAKFAAALTITVAIYAGPFALYLIPIAMVLGAVYRLGLQLSGRSSGPRAHGPAIAVAGVSVLLLAVVFG
jgi:leader peptidase (prepilin peptidase)/N-methyltransferase